MRKHGFKRVATHSRHHEPTKKRLKITDAPQRTRFYDKKILLGGIVSGFAQKPP